MSIRSFKDADTKRVWDGESPKRIPHNLLKVADRKLTMIDAAKSLEDLRVPPSNHLEALKGKRLGQHSIRINIQWRVCFTWLEGDAWDVQIVDYHDER
jgi:proteic killer suppression protein